MKTLTLQEEIVLTTIWRLSDEAYGVSIRKKVEEVTKKNFMYGTMFNTLSQLLRKGYVTKVKGEPTSERGGRAKMYYKITKEGFLVLENTRNLHQSIWDGLPEFVTE